MFSIWLESGLLQEGWRLSCISEAMQIPQNPFLTTEQLGPCKQCQQGFHSSWKTWKFIDSFSSYRKHLENEKNDQMSCKCLWGPGKLYAWLYSCIFVLVQGHHYFKFIHDIRGLLELLCVNTFSCIVLYSQYGTFDMFYLFFKLWALECVTLRVWGWFLFSWLCL